MSYKTLVNITNSLIANYPASTAWNGSDFNWIRGLPPASKGAIGRDIGSGLLQAYGFTLERTGMSFESMGKVY